MWRHYVYIHRRASDGLPFYVGKGVARKRDKVQRHERAHTTHSRNVDWKRIVAEHGFAVEVVMSCQTDTEAQYQEIELIRSLGRGTLVNLTDGGDGHTGIIISDSARQKRRIAASGKRSHAWVASIRLARKNGGNGGVVKHGDRLPEAWVANIASAKVGAKNPYFGKPSPPAKKVKNLKTGAVYDSIHRAAMAEGISPKTLYQYLDGSRLNRSPLVRI